MHSTIRS